MLEGNGLKILFATQNREKLAEASEVLARYGFEVVNLDVNLLEPDAGSVEEMAKIKLQQVMEQGIDHVMVDDAGICFAAYPHFPSILSKRIFNGIGYKGIDKLLCGEPREAWFEGTIALCWDGQVHTFSGRTEGKIIDGIMERKITGSSFPFDPIFVPTGDTRVLQEMSFAERVMYSYRRKALEKMVAWLDRYGE